MCRCHAGKFGYANEIEANETYKLIAYKQNCDSFKLNKYVVEQAKNFEAELRLKND